MTTSLKPYSFLTLLLVFASVTFAADPMVEKKKTVSKTYDLSANDEVSLDNRFGELKISTWDRNEIKVDITITAKGSTEERATEILDRINIDEGKRASGVFFKTLLEQKNGRNKNNNTYKDEGFSINYVVMMPTRNRLRAFNEFGPTIITDYSGEITIENKFGSLTTGKLANPKKVTVEFGSAEIQSMTNGQLVVKFSRAIVGNMDGVVDAKFEHCSGVQLNLDNNLKGLVVRNDFTNLQLNVTRALSARFNISTNFGEFNNKSDFDISNYDDDNGDRGPKFKKQYVGKSGSGNVSLKISAEFSNITVGHGLKMDIKDAKKKSGTSVSI